MPNWTSDKFKEKKKSYCVFLLSASDIFFIIEILKCIVLRIYELYCTPSHLNFSLCFVFLVFPCFSFQKSQIVISASPVVSAKYLNNDNNRQHGQQ